MAKRYTLNALFRGKFLYTDCRNLDAMIKRSKEVTKCLEAAKAAGAKTGGNPEDDYIDILMNDESKAEQLERDTEGFFSFEDENEEDDGEEEEGEE